MTDRDALDAAATPQRLRALGRAGALGEAELARALALSTATPPLGQWLRFLSQTLLLLGALLSASGVIYFFAFNWAKLPTWSKFALTEGAVALVALSALRPAASEPARRVALLTASLLVGPLLGVYGQTYQTGADPWTLFALWAALITPWSITARAPSLWLLHIVVVDVTLGLWLDQAFAAPDGVLWLPSALAAINGGAWLLWEALSARGAPGLAGRWWPRLMATSAMVALLVPSVRLVFDLVDASSGTGFALEALAVGGSLAWFRRRDLYLVVAALGSAMVVGTSWVGWVLFERLKAGDEAMLLMGLLVVAEVGLAVTWLRRLGASREGD